jgi:hypothetical protein
MKTKLITGYWMNSPGFPFKTVGDVRKDRYLGSIKAHCENIGLPIICYTNKMSIPELEELKIKYNLDNLTIKIMELSDMKYHNKFMKIRESGIEEGDGRGCEILWGKIQVMENELNDCDRIFWIDAGLQHPGIFPWRFSKKYFKKEDHSNSIPGWWTEYDVYNFKDLLNQKTFENLYEMTMGKLLILGSSSPQTINDYYELGLVDNVVSDPFPIGGLFGGDIPQVKTFIDSFWVESDKLLDMNQLKTEEYIMKLSYDKMIDSEKISIPFDIHTTYNHDEFHFEDWDIEKDPKPLYMVWNDILNYNK